MATEVRKNLQSLNLSAKQIKMMTSDSGATWPNELVNDYLTILDNFIDVATATDSSSGLIDENKKDIIINKDNIQVNKDNIQVNSDNIQANTDKILINIENIQVNADNILNLEFRVLSRQRPDAYNQDYGYFKGMTVVEPSDDYQYYYKAIEDIPAPAGLFDDSKWQRVSLLDAITPTDFCEILTGGAVLLSALVNNAANSFATVTSSASSSSATVTTPDVGSAPAEYSQAYADSQTSLINDIKSNHNSLVSDFNSAVSVINDIRSKHNTMLNDLNLFVTQFNDLIAKSKDAKQMSEA